MEVYLAPRDTVPYAPVLKIVHPCTRQDIVQDAIPLTHIDRQAGFPQGVSCGIQIREETAIVHKVNHTRSARERPEEHVLFYAPQFERLGLWRYRLRRFVPFYGPWMECVL